MFVSGTAAAEIAPTKTAAVMKMLENFMVLSLVVPIMQLRSES